MNIKQLIYIMIIATVACWGIWLVVINKIDPTVAGIFDFMFFYLSLFFALLGTFFLLSFGFRKFFNKFSLEYKIVGASFRQSIFFALLIIAILFLQSRDFLTWWNIILLILAVSILEFFFLSAKRTV